MLSSQFTELYVSSGSSFGRGRMLEDHFGKRRGELDELTAISDIEFAPVADCSLDQLLGELQGVGEEAGLLGYPFREWIWSAYGDAGSACNHSLNVDDVVLADVDQVEQVLERWSRAVAPSGESSESFESSALRTGEKVSLPFCSTLNFK